ncbi:MAG: hypothetical protein WAU81_12590 [Candidatus Aminicenantales bacterium]
MSEGKSVALIVDANSLIDLIKLGALISVAQLAEYQFLIIDEVVNEIRRPEQAGILQEAIRRGLISKVSISTLNELELFAKLQTVLDLGEAASLAYASINRCLFLSDETQRAFMREVRAHIGEKRLVRTHTVLAVAIKRQKLGLSALKAEVEKLKKTAYTLRDWDDIQHLQRVLDRTREAISEK